MSHTVQVLSVDLNATLPSTALYTVGARVLLSDGDFAAIPEDSRHRHLQIIDSSPGTPVAHPAPTAFYEQQTYATVGHIADNPTDVEGVLGNRGLGVGYVDEGAAVVIG